MVIEFSAGDFMLMYSALDYFVFCAEKDLLDSDNPDVNQNQARINLNKSKACMRKINAYLHQHGLSAPIEKLSED